MTRNHLWGRAIGRIATLATAGAVAILAQGCSKDTGGEYVISLQTDRTALSGDGADSATVRVSILDADYNPPAIGSQVVLVAAPSGNVNGSGASQGVAQTDTLGFAEFEVRCTEAGETLQVLATFDGQRGVLRTGIDCTEPPSGDWTLQVSAEPRRIGTQASSQITVRAIDGSGAPVAEGTSVRLEIQGNGLEFSRGGLTLVRPVDAAGQLSTNVISTTVEGSASVCASFEDERFGSGSACVAIVVSNTEVQDATCIGTFSQSRAPADGEEITDMTITVADRTGTPIEGAVIEVDIAAGEFVDGAGAPVGTSLTLNTDSNGDAFGQIVAPTNPDSVSAQATASFSENGENRVIDCAFVEQLVFYPRPTCLFEGMDPEILGVQTSGINETGELAFCFTGLENTPVPAGQRVTFDFAVQLSGATLGSSSAITDEQGCVSVELFSGTQAGNVEIRATYPFGTTNSVCTSGPLPIRGARPVEGGMNLTCEVHNIGALWSARGSDITTACDVQCSTYLRDRFGNPVTFPGTQVFFAAEQGMIVSPVQPDDNGLVVTTYRPNGLPPRDVEPLDNEPSVTRILGATSREQNPRDMVVSIIAWTSGEEDWEDINGNSAYDDDEPFTDLPEPFLDFNDDDVMNPEAPLFETFIDIANEDREFNGEWDIENNEWDNDTAIWTQTRVTLSGEPVFGSTNQAPFGGSVNVNPPLFSYGWQDDLTDDVIEFTFSRGERTEFGFILRDEYFNAAAFSTDFAFVTDCEGDVAAGREDGSSEHLPAWSRTLAWYDADGNPTDDANRIFSFRWVSSHESFLGDDGAFGTVLPYAVTLDENDEAERQQCFFSFDMTVAITPGCGEAFTAGAGLPTEVR